MIYVINFATEEYKKARELNTVSAYEMGADKVFEYTLSDIDHEFYLKNKQILEQKRGCGYWLWKPYFIFKTLSNCEEGDWIIYTDSAMYFRKNINEYIENLDKQKINIISRQLKFKESQFNKRDVLIEMQCDTDTFVNTRQRAASVIIIKNCEKNRSFIKEWLVCSQNAHWITDEENKSGNLNYSDFIDHRHDQSIFSLLCKKNNIAYNDDLFLDILFLNKKNSLLVDHHTKAGTKWGAYIKSIKRGFDMLLGDFRRERVNGK